MRHASWTATHRGARARPDLEDGFRATGLDAAKRIRELREKWAIGRVDIRKLIEEGRR